MEAGRIVRRLLICIYLCIQIYVLLDIAQQSANKANVEVEFKRPDKAYIEWLMSSDIILNLIPLHKDYQALNRKRGDFHEKYKSLYKVRLPSEKS